MMQEILHGSLFLNNNLYLKVTEIKNMLNPLNALENNAYMNKLANHSYSEYLFIKYILIFYGKLTMLFLLLELCREMGLALDIYKQRKTNRKLQRILEEN